MEFNSFEWDEANIRHIAEHNVSVEEVEYVLSQPTLDLGYNVWRGEERFAEAGATVLGRILQVVTTERANRTRVVTAYDASAHVVKEYLRTR